MDIKDQDGNPVDIVNLEKTEQELVKEYIEENDIVYYNTQSQNPDEEYNFATSNTYIDSFVKLIKSITYIKGIKDNSQEIEELNAIV